MNIGPHADDVLPNAATGRVPTHDDWTAVALASVAVAVTMLDTFGVSQSLPSIGHELGASDTELQWILNATTLASAIALIPAGRAGDRWGRRRLAVGGLAVFGVGEFLAALAGTMPALIAARIVVGIGMAAVVASSLAITTAAVRPENRAKAIARWTAITAAGGAIGPLAAGAMTQHLSWRWFLAALGLVALAMGLFLHARIAESRDPTTPRSFDGLGIVTLAIGLGGTIYGLMIIPDVGVSDVGALVGLGAGVVGMTAFIVVERRVPAPLLDLDLFLRHRYLAIAAVALIANWAYAVMIFYVPQYLQNVLGYGATAAGALFLVFTVPYGVLSLLVGRLESRVAAAVLTTVGLGVLAVAFVAAGLISATQGVGMTIAALLIAAVGQSLVFNASGTQAMESGGGAGTASGALSTVRQLGFLLGLAVTGTIIQVTQAWRLGVELSDHGVELSWAERTDVLAGAGGTSLHPASLPAEVVNSSWFAELGDRLLVDGLRGGYWSVAVLCALAMLAARASRSATNPRETAAPG